MSADELALLDRLAEHHARLESLSLRPEDLDAEEKTNKAIVERDNVNAAHDRIVVQRTHRDAKDNYLANKDDLIQGGRKLMDQDLMDREAEAKRLREQLAGFEYALHDEGRRKKDAIEKQTESISKMREKVDLLMDEYDADPTSEKEENLEAYRQKLEQQIRDKHFMQVAAITDRQERVSRIETHRQRIDQLEEHLKLTSKKTDTDESDGKDLGKGDIAEVPDKVE